jgi:hypothetical protein
MPKIDNSLIGIAGVHFVVSELSLRGLVALPTIRNTAGIDIVVVNTNGTLHANIQVKTSKDKVGFWPIGSRFNEWRGENNLYAFVRYLKNELRFEVFLESAENVAEQVVKNMAHEKEKGNREWAPFWKLPKSDNDLARLRRQWREFGNQA